MLSMRLYMLQRLSALIMVPLVLGHLALMVYAIQGGLTAEEILGRTQGSLIWFMFYGLFVLASATHAGIGLGVILTEWTSIKAKHSSEIALFTGLFLFLLGARAVWAVTYGVGP